MQIGLSMGMKMPMGLSLIQRAIGILNKYGTDAHLYLPGVGMVSGKAAGNYLENTFTNLATVDSAVGGVRDAEASIHATQPTAANRPMLRRGAVNLLNYSQDFTNAAWEKLDGGTVTLADGGHLCTQTVRQGSTPSPSIRTAAFEVRRATTGSASHVRVTTNDTVAWGTGASTKLLLTSEWQTVVCSVPANIAVYAILGRYNASSGVDPDCNGSFVVRAGGLFSGTYTAAQIQALGGIPLTTTAPASTALGSYFWQFDGVNDSLSLSAPLFQMADDHCVIAGLNNTSGAASSKVAFSQYGTTTRRVAQLSFETTTLTATWTDDAATAGTSPNGSVVTAGTAVVATACKVGNAKTLRKNGVLVNTSSTTAGTTTLTNAVIGANSANYFTGAIYPVIAIKGTVTDSDLLTLERFIGSLSGVTI